jgi:phage gp36-like protein
MAPDGNVVGTAGELDDEQLNDRIVQAQARVDAVVGESFDTDNVPALVKGLVIAIGAYYATLAYRKSKAVEPTHPVYLQYVDAMGVLKDISTGSIDLNPQPDTDTPVVNRRPIVHNPNPATMFGLDDVGLSVTTGRHGPRFEERGDGW